MRGCKCPITTKIPYPVPLSCRKFHSSSLLDDPGPIGRDRRKRHPSAGTPPHHPAGDNNGGGGQQPVSYKKVKEGERMRELAAETGGVMGGGL